MQLHIFLSFHIMTWNHLFVFTLPKSAPDNITTNMKAIFLAFQIIWSNMENTDGKIAYYWQ